MKKFIIAVLTLFSIPGFAQSPVSTRLSSGYDVGMAYSKNNYNPSLAYYQMINIGERKLFSLGWTLRLGAYYGDNLNYYTAPARLTRGKTGFNALSEPLIIKNIDTVRMDYSSMTSLNLGIRAQVNLGVVELGASAELLGLTLGKSRTGRYRSSTGYYKQTNAAGVDSTIYFRVANADQKTRPSRLNVRLLGDNDIGTLSTEVYARIRISQRLSARVAYQWLTTEIKVNNRDAEADNDRFRSRVGMVYAGLTFPIFY
ncbi:hypothetical protein [Spirosoma oryzicola]|uniref:hypothetical protein n=1 Tax=Spirosoma oryzicola TaxID=2898794 RepID=UPI001E2FD23E|nr:hypothetical protein [Spirosoma oryzicola]UHG90601.1 hypothetical protein LQ777_20415 [Spirosoma oryzicola]